MLQRIIELMAGLPTWQIFVIGIGIAIVSVLLAWLLTKPVRRVWRSTRAWFSRRKRRKARRKRLEVMSRRTSLFDDLKQEILGELDDRREEIRQREEELGRKAEQLLDESEDARQREEATRQLVDQLREQAEQLHAAERELLDREEDLELQVEDRRRPDGYVPSDSEVERDRSGRMAFLAFSLVVMTGLPVLLLSPWLGLHGLVIGLALGVAAFAETSHHFLVIVPMWQGLTAHNLRTGMITIFGPGLHVKYPWETVSAADHQSLETVTDVIEEDYPTLGDTLSVLISYLWYPRLTHLAIFKGVDETTINHGFRGILSEMFSGHFATDGAENIKSNQEAIARRFMEALMGETSKDDQHYLKKVLFEDTAGVVFAFLALADVDYSAAVKDIRATKTQHQTLGQNVAEMLGYENYAQVMEARRGNYLDEGALNVAWDRVLVIARLSERRQLHVDGGVGPLAIERLASGVTEGGTRG